MTTCSVKFCRNSTNNFILKANGIAFYRFPEDPALREKWIAATGRLNWAPTMLCVICAIHFTEDCFSKNLRHILHDTAIPTLCLPSNAHSNMGRINVNEQLPEQDDAGPELLQFIEQNTEQVLENCLEFVVVPVPDQNISIDQSVHQNLYTADNLKQLPGFESMWVLKHVPQQSHTNEIEQSQQQYPEETLEASADQSSEQPGAQILEQTPNLGTEQVSQYIPNSVQQFIPNQLPHYISNTILQFIPNQVPQFITNQTPEYITTQVPEFITNPLPKYVTNQIPEFITNPVPNFITNPIPQFMINQVPEYVVNPLPEYVTNRAPEYISSQLPQYIPNQVLDQDPQQTASLDQTNLPIQVEEHHEEAILNDESTPPPQCDYNKSIENMNSINTLKLCARIEHLEDEVLNRKRAVKRLYNQVGYLNGKVKALDVTVKRLLEKDNGRMKCKREKETNQGDYPPARERK